MKKAILLTMIIGILALAGCKKSTACWYPIEGGHINLDNVTRISSEARLLLWADEDIVKNEWGLKEINKDTLIDGVITESNIEKAIARLKSTTKNYSHANANAAIIFDNFTVKLQDTDDIPGGWSDNKGLVKLLQMWLDAKKDVDSML